MDRAPQTPNQRALSAAEQAEVRGDFWAATQPRSAIDNYWTAIGYLDGRDGAEIENRRASLKDKIDRLVRLQARATVPYHG